jgi:hypothetical protein
MAEAVAQEVLRQDLHVEAMALKLTALLARGLKVQVELLMKKVARRNHKIQFALMEAMHLKAKAQDQRKMTKDLNLVNQITIKAQNLQMAERRELGQKFLLTSRT